MNKLTLLAASAMVAASMNAAITTPVCYSENFVKMGATEDYPVGWVTYGNGAMPAVQEGLIDWKTFFPNGADGPYYTLLNFGNQCAPVSCTSFEGDVAADQWLVSPSITLPDAASMLSFTFVDYNNQGAFGLMSGGVPIKVLVSDKGTAKEDFSEVALYEGNAPVNVATEIYQRQFILPLTGYEGKTVNFAFVQNGLNCGPVGFTNITVGNYYIDLTNLTKQVAYMDETVTVDVNSAIRTPVECGGAYATLKINGEVVVDKKFYKKTLFTSNPNTRPIIRFKFDDVAVVNERKSINYELTITPDYEGAVPTIVTGTVGVPALDYVNNVVIEEPTASGCGYCPAGIASMEWYMANYPGGENKSKAIGIAIHGYMNYPDPMNDGVQGYLSQVNALAELSGLPAATYNRATRGLYPWNREGFMNQTSRRSQNKVVIKKVEVPEVATDEEIFGKTLKVTFDVYNSYDAVSVPLNMSAVMIENDVRGYEDGYRQENYIAQKGVEDWKSHGSEWNAEFLEKFAYGGELGKSMIPADKMVYQHVARGVWPTFDGDAISGEWTADTARELTLEFAVPDNVLEFKNTEVIVLITDAETKEIVAADIIPASEYTPSSGVKDIMAPGASAVEVENGTITVKNNSLRGVALYSLDGVKLTEVNGAERVTLTPAAHGVYLLRIATSAGVEIRKVVL